MDGPQYVAPGEAILAVIGVRPLLTKEVERIRAPQWREIARIEDTIEKRSRQFVRGEPDRAEKYPDVDYGPTLEAFTRPPDPAQIMAMLQDVPTPMALPFLSTAARAYNFLRGQFPIAQERTVFGVTPLEPGDFALAAFEDMLELIDRPLSVFNAAESGRLTTKQAAALRTVYPTFYSEVAVNLVLSFMDEKGAHPTTFDPEFGRGMSVILGIPGVDPNLKAQLAAQPPPEPPPEQKRLAAAKSQRAQLIATPSDRLELAEQ